MNRCPSCGSPGGRHTVECCLPLEEENTRLRSVLKRCVEALDQSRELLRANCCGAWHQTVIDRATLAIAAAKAEGVEP